MDKFSDGISALLESGDAAENLEGLRAIDSLIEVSSLGEGASKVSLYLHAVLETKRDEEVLVAASGVLGHLARSGGAMAADEVARKVEGALQWLRGDGEDHRLAAVLVLREVAENAPSVFNVHVPVFLDAIWAALWDATRHVRERAVEALRACLMVIEKRETRMRVQWYYRMFEAAQEGLGNDASVHTIHGSLLAVGELLRNTGEFMMSRYRELEGIILKFLHHGDRLIRLTIISLLPRIAYLRHGFVTNYLKICMDGILAILRTPAESAYGFSALGEMACAVDGELIQYMPTITSHLRDAIAPRRGKPSPEALACVGCFAKAMGPIIEFYIHSLMDSLFYAGLSTTLVETLELITISIPSLLPTVQGRLLDCISVVLSRKPYAGSINHASGSHRVQLALRALAHFNLKVLNTVQGCFLDCFSVVLSRKPYPQGRDGGSHWVQLALRTLAHFNFKGHELLELAKGSVVPYLEDEDGATRRDAALCCCQLIANSLSGIACSQFTSNRSGRIGRSRRRMLIQEIVERLLITAVADADIDVRKSVFLSLISNVEFDEFLAQAENLTAIVAALNDEDYEVRELSTSVAGRLSERNPAYVLPKLRCHLKQLLTHLEQSTHSKCREESSKLLGCLIRNCERLIIPYIAPIHKVLVAKLREGTGVNANNDVVTGVLATVGELAKVGGFAMKQHLPELMPLIVEALMDGASVAKREVAVSTLGQVLQSTGYVVAPYNEYPQLLSLLLKLLNGELAWTTRREVLKVLGIMGALDPHVLKCNQQRSAGSHGEVGLPAGDTSQHIRSMEELPTELWTSFAASEDYYSTVAINSLMRILCDSLLSSYHQKVVGSLLFIFKTMGLGCVPYLPKVLPELLHAVRTCEDGLKEYIVWKLGTLVSIVRQHMRKYLPDFLSLISELWPCSFNLPAVKRSIHGSPILHLVEQLCLALNDEFREYLPAMLPRCIQVLTDAERCNDYSYVPDMLHTFEVFRGTLDEHANLLLPVLIRLFKVDAPVDARRAAINTVTKLIPRVQVTGHVSSLVHHLKLVLDGNSDDLRKDAIDALCCLANVLGEDFSIFVPSIHEIMVKHRLRHKDFDVIEGCFMRCQPLTMDNFSGRESVQHAPLEVISDPINDADSDSYEEGPDIHRKPRTYQVNYDRLRNAVETSRCSTKEDWAEWMRHLSNELLKESPSPVLRTCARLAQLQPFFGRELFFAGFVSCWSQLSETSQQHLVQNLEQAFSSANITPEILATLLNLAEFMEHHEKPLPIDIRLLGALAEKSCAFAKALRYKEMEFAEGNTVSSVEALFKINKQLHQHEAADGILTYSQKNLGVQLKESWYESLQRWDDALQAYTLKASQAINADETLDATLGRIRCLAALARWEELNGCCKEYWTLAEPAAQLEMAPMAASAAWSLGEWDQMSEYVAKLDDSDENKLQVLGNTASSGHESSNGSFFRAVLSVHRGKYDGAREYVERARKCLAPELAALVLESYERAYGNMVRVQQLSELEEVIDYHTLPVGSSVAEGRRDLIRNMWNGRIRGTKQNVEVWQGLLSVRALVLPPTEDVETWLKFASLCRKSGRTMQAKSTLLKLMQCDPDSSDGNMMHPRPPPQVLLAYLKHQWSLGEDSKRREAFAKLQDLSIQLESMENLSSGISSNPHDASSHGIPLLARVYLNLGRWKWALSDGLDDGSIHEILESFWNATQRANHWGKAWHTWALFNTAVTSHYSLRVSPSIVDEYVVAAVNGYFYSIACAATSKGVDDSLQDILRLLTLWFNHGATSEVDRAMKKGFSIVSLNTWLAVLPQIIARIHTNNQAVRELIQSLLVHIGRSHPQALMYPLLVACKSISLLRRAAAQEVVDKVRQHSGELVDQAQLVSKELIRVAVLWHEMWHEALEEASHLCFEEYNVQGMLNVLEPLHAMLEDGSKTENEHSFIQTYGHELLEARECCQKYKKTGNDAQLTQAWNLYCHIFRRIDKQLPSLTTLDLQSVSPALFHCRNLELAVPGTYRAGGSVVTISSFGPQLVVLKSKQRPRKLSILGSDGEDYTFLVKGHEDLRQDERVMQLFGLVNALLENSRKTAKKGLSIQRYAVVPLSPNSGLIGWVPNCDTLDYLIREYREDRKIFLNQEHMHMLAFAPDYDHLPLMGKVEAFQHALKCTDGNDLARVLWLKSRTSEVWLDRRTNYTRSLAVMSMVGYLLGLGDRHPGNLMLHRYSGKIVHIDFGDCFEVAMHREFFPEKVPFRLTRMLVKAMELSGVEGTFRSTCENVMEVLRTNKDSLIAIMEAFVHDPLINWRLLNFNEVPQTTSFGTTPAHPAANGDETVPQEELAQPLRGARERELLQAVNQLGDANEVLNERAVVVMGRMSDKLTGWDFSSGHSASNAPSVGQQAVDHNTLISGDGREVEHGLSVESQVQQLIFHATAQENLCQNYVGWCPFW